MYALGHHRFVRGDGAECPFCGERFTLGALRSHVTNEWDDCAAAFSDGIAELYADAPEEAAPLEAWIAARAVSRYDRHRIGLPIVLVHKMRDTTDGFLYPCGGATSRASKHKCGRGGMRGLSCVGAALEARGLPTNGGELAQQRPVTRALGPVVFDGRALNLTQIKALRRNELERAIEQNGVDVAPASGDECTVS